MEPIMQKVARYKADFTQATGRDPEELLVGIIEYCRLRDAVNLSVGQKLYPSKWECGISYDGMDVTLCNDMHGLWVQ